MEEKVFFKNSKGDRLVGILSDSTGNKDKPIVILCHGHSSSKNSKLYVKLEELLNEKKIATLRFDFYGHGESDGKYEDSLVSEAADDIS